MPNAIYRDRMINNIQHAVKEAINANRTDHPGLVGRIRELAAENILMPILPAAFEMGTGKIVDRNGTLSAEVDLVIYNRALLPALMYSNRDGIFPIESTYYVLEIKSKSNARNLRDAIEKVQKIKGLDHSKKEHYSGNRSPVVPVYFAFGSDLSVSGKTEFERYKELDSEFKDDPIVRVICVVGHGYWFFSEKDKEWLYQVATNTFDEVLILVSHIVNTLMPHPSGSIRPAPLFGDYLRPPQNEMEEHGSIHKDIQ